MVHLFIIIILIFPYSSWGYLSFGNASDDCNWATDKTLEKAVWNCDGIFVASTATIDVDLNEVKDPIQLRSQGNVVIEGIINISATTTLPGPGGGRGANCGAGVCNNVNAPGSTTGEGQGASAGDGGGFGAANGGGGGGAGYFVNGDDGSPGVGGGGLSDGALGSGGSSFVTVNSLSTSLQGAPGGGGGGSGDDGTFTETGAGGNGGNGSGSIAIISKGTITIASGAQINARGDSGKDGASTTGGAEGGNGGSGAGGTVYLVSDQNISINNAVIDVEGGAANTNGAGAAGGKGSDGIIRIDTPNGTFSGSVNQNPGGVTVNTSTTPSSIIDPLPLAEQQELFESDIEAACTYRESINYELNIIIFLSSFFISIFLLLKLNKLRW